MSITVLSTLSAHAHAHAQARRSSTAAIGTQARNAVVDCMFPRFSTSPAHSPRTFGRLPNKEFNLQSDFSMLRMATRHCEKFEMTVVATL
ncbi:hypothetical protein K445DRAFT_316269 [Daldinia sp. EC12]|nr:hypothetical protein K445DRAFT_316269 [Daldinia sp. EC12]